MEPRAMRCASRRRAQASPAAPRSGWGVGALGLIVLGALGATLVPRYLGALPAPVATAPTAAGALSPAEPAATGPATAEVVLSPEAVSRAGITTAPAKRSHPGHHSAARDRDG